MKVSLTNLLLLLLAASLLASCANSGVTYWIPPTVEETPVTLEELLTRPMADRTPEPTSLPEPSPSPDLTESSPSPGQALLEAGEETPVVETQPAVETSPPAGGSPGVQQVPPLEGAPVLYYAQAADTLPVVAVRFGVEPSEITSPDPISPTGFISPGQLLVIPRRLGETTSPEKLIPDSEIVFSPSAIDFDIQDFANLAGGKLSGYKSWLKSTGITSGANIILRVALENSINPRLLVSLLEYQGGWVYGEPGNTHQENFPLGNINNNQEGLFKQLVWAVNQLSVGYYAYREGRMTEIRFPDGGMVRLAPDLNAGTAALQYFFAQLYNEPEWLQALDPNAGFPALHAQMFGNPWTRAATVEPLFPSGIVQPELILPFVRDWKWSYTGGPHGAWEHDGAYAALDFAPGSTEPGCVKSTAWVLAAASGLVVRSGGGIVVLDLDGDGREQTGWVLTYLHVSSEQRVPVGQWVDLGDPLGHPSCEGGISTGTHLHIARKYNGEWIPADGPLPFNLGGWIAHAGPAAYKGTLTRDGQTVEACTCSSAASHIVRTGADP